MSRKTHFTPCTPALYLDTRDGEVIVEHPDGKLVLNGSELCSLCGGRKHSWHRREDLRCDHVISARLLLIQKYLSNQKPSIQEVI